MWSRFKAIARKEIEISEGTTWNIQEIGFKCEKIFNINYVEVSPDSEGTDRGSYIELEGNVYTTVAVILKIGRYQGWNSYKEEDIEKRDQNFIFDRGKTICRHIQKATRR